MYLSCDHVNVCMWPWGLDKGLTDFINLLSSIFIHGHICRLVNFHHLLAYPMFKMARILYVHQGPEADLLLFLDEIIKEKRGKWWAKDTKQGVKGLIIYPLAQKMQEKKQANDVPFGYTINLFFFLHSSSEGIRDKIFTFMLWILSSPLSFLLCDAPSRGSVLGYSPLVDRDDSSYLEHDRQMKFTSLMCS